VRGKRRKAAAEQNQRMVEMSSIEEKRTEEPDREGNLAEQRPTAKKTQPLLTVMT
jgi:hypothetical protein